MSGNDTQDIKDRNLTVETADAYLHNTHILESGGNKTSYHVDPDDLYQVMSLVEIGVPKVIQLDCYVGGFESYFPSKNIALLDTPLIDVIGVAVANSEVDDIDGE